MTAAQVPPPTLLTAVNKQVAFDGRSGHATGLLTAVNKQVPPPPALLTAVNEAARHASRRAAIAAVKSSKR